MLFLIICIFPIASSRLRGHIYYIEFVQLQRIAKYTRFDICVVRCFRIYIDCRIICFVFVSRKILCIRLDHFTFYFFHPNWLFSGAQSSLIGDSILARLWRTFLITTQKDLLCLQIQVCAIIIIVCYENFQKNILIIN